MLIESKRLSLTDLTNVPVIADFALGAMPLGLVAATRTAL